MAPVRAALVTPLSGPMGGFGRAGAAALALWADRFSGPDQVRLTVVDAHPAGLSWLGSVHGHRVRPLGVEAFGQSGSIAEVYGAYGLDTQAILRAALAG